MKTIYTKENFMHINSEYSQSTFNVFFDNIQHSLELKTEEDYINIPIYKYSYISFPKQYAKHVSISNQRRLTEATTEKYADQGFKKYKDITFAEVITGTPDNLIFLFTENEQYLDRFENIAIDNLKPNTKLIILKDDFMQFGSNYLFRNNGASLVESFKAFITEKVVGFEEHNITIIGSRSGAKPAKLYASLFPEYKLVTFNTEHSIYTSEIEQYEISVNGFVLRDGIEISTYSIDALKHEHHKESHIMVNTDKYSFVEAMKLTMFFAQINNNLKAVVELVDFKLDFVNERCQLPTNITSKPLFAYLSSDNILQKLPVYAYGGEYYIKQTTILNAEKNLEMTVITEQNIYKLKVEGQQYDQNI